MTVQVAIYKKKIKTWATGLGVVTSGSFLPVPTPINFNAVEIGAVLITR